MFRSPPRLCNDHCGLRLCLLTNSHADPLQYMLCTNRRFRHASIRSKELTEQLFPHSNAQNLQAINTWSFVLIYPDTSLHLLTIYFYKTWQTNTLSYLLWKWIFVCIWFNCECICNNPIEHFLGKLKANIIQESWQAGLEFSGGWIFHVNSRFHPMSCMNGNKEMSNLWSKPAAFGRSFSKPKAGILAMAWNLHHWNPSGGSGTEGSPKNIFRISPTFSNHKMLISPELFDLN